VLAALLLAAALWGAWEVATWPDVARLTRERPATTAFIERYRAQARAQGRPDRVAWAWAPYGAISRDVKRAVLVAEDVGFFSHRGFDLPELEKAVRESLRDAELPRGASTITQQLAKNLWLTPSRNPWRKVKEALLTWQLERALGKRRILELYLNVVELGPGVYGVQSAAHRYFGRGAAELGPEEAAQLAAALSRPSEWHPGVASPAYHRRVALIRLRMERAKILDRQIRADGADLPDRPARSVTDDRSL
jgi:monofunctional biosynthetic peptidoglycan transglycosylase